ncbi:MAG: hypothetical protein O3A80_03570 [bacterium]|nr:hypothetical protein [bacterium]MDA1292343.1 hypothetical protein [bacterium]
MPGKETRTVDDETAYGTGPGVDPMPTPPMSETELLTGDPRAASMETAPEVFALLADETSETGSAPIPEETPVEVAPHGMPMYEIEMSGDIHGRKGRHE